MANPKRALIKRERGSVEYSYTIDQLRSLKEHLDYQPEFHYALRFFFAEQNLEPDYLETLEHWLRMAEEIRKDPDYIEKKIADASQSMYCRIEVEK